MENHSSHFLKTLLGIMAFIFIGVLIFKGKPLKEDPGHRETTLVQSQTKDSRIKDSRHPAAPKARRDLDEDPSHKATRSLALFQQAPERSLTITENEHGQRIIADDIIVSFLKGSDIAEVKKIEQKYNLIVHSYHSESGIAHFKIPPFYSMPSEKLRKKIKSENIIVVASEPNYVVRFNSYPNEFQTFAQNQLWHLDNTGRALPYCLETQAQTCTSPKAEKSIDTTAGNFESFWNTQSCALTAVVDTGFDLEHPDLKNRLLGGASISYGEGLPVIPIVQSRTSSYDPGTLQAIVNTIKDLNDQAQNNNTQALQTLKALHSDLIHGTAVAALIVAEGNNGVGGVGLCASGQLIPVQAARLDLDSNNTPMVVANTATIAEGIRYAAKNGAKVINVSMGEYWRDKDNKSLPKSSCHVSAPCHLLEAIEYAHSQGAIVVTSAGNDGMDTDTVPHYPSNLSYERPDLQVVSVGGHNADGSLGMAQKINTSNILITFFETNYGKNSVTLTAPSTYIFHLLLSQNLENQFLLNPKTNQSYSRDDLFKEVYSHSTSSYPSHSYGFGTSFSAPLVTAVLAMIYQKLLDTFPATQNPNKDYAKTAKKILLENIKSLQTILTRPSPLNTSIISSMENKSQAGASIIDAKASIEAINTLGALEDPDPSPIYNVPLELTEESIPFKGCMP